MGSIGKRGKDRGFTVAAVVALVCAAMISASPVSAVDKKQSIKALMNFVDSLPDRGV